MYTLQYLHQNGSNYPFDLQSELYVYLQSQNIFNQLQIENFIENKSILIQKFIDMFYQKWIRKEFAKKALVPNSQIFIKYTKLRKEFGTTNNLNHIPESGQTH